MDPKAEVNEREEGMIGLDEIEETEGYDEDGAVELDEDDGERLDTHFAYLLAH